MVLALAVSGADLFAAGAFTRAGGIPVGGVARWRNGRWYSMGAAPGGFLWALATWSDQVFVAGLFPESRHNIARWDGSRWSLMGFGLGGGDLGISPFPEPWYDPTARALAVSGGELYVGGRFTTAGGKVSPYVAKARIATPPTLHFSRADGGIRLTWEGGTILQHGTSLEGRPIGWRDVPNASSPHTLQPPADSLNFYRLRVP